MDKNKIIIFDTTLRDGEQSPGASMNTDEKIHLALQLEKLGVDVIEAGFAAASPGDFDAIEKIAAGKGIYTPIVNEVASMLRGKDVQESLKDLLSKK
ncbi:hypothetical protein [uncultured Campylobacter sp.]|uniref:hypothetical protein n=1 Tax=uncultured Campylobacter sp. TaxID=218934 RepID=UPI002606AADE|nr:hypothetical protein [uncultured Campylobacter sp.]